MSWLKGPKMPEQRPPARMPDPDDPDVVEAKRRDIFRRGREGGRASTILTGATRPAATGYDSYTSDKL